MGGGGSAEGGAEVFDTGGCGVEAEAEEAEEAEEEAEVAAEGVGAEMIGVMRAAAATQVLQMYRLPARSSKLARGCFAWLPSRSLGNKHFLFAHSKNSAGRRPGPALWKRGFLFFCTFFALFTDLASGS